MAEVTADGRGARAARLMEMVALFGAIPVALAIYGPRWALPVLFVATPLCLAVLCKDASFPRENLLRPPPPGALRWVTLRAAAISGVSALGMGWLDPSHAFGLVRERPWLWLLVVFAYPVLSVVPQEIVFRSFFLHRYKPSLGSEAAAVAGSGVAFAIAHVVLRNWLAVALTLVGGLLFARTYLRTRSLPAVAWEHALYGIALFTIGLGRYFVTRWVQP